MSEPRRLDRNNLLAAALRSGIPNLKSLAELCGVNRVTLSNTANRAPGYPLTPGLEASLRRVLGERYETIFEDTDECVTCAHDIEVHDKGGCVITGCGCSDHPQPLDLND